MKREKVRRLLDRYLLRLVEICESERDAQCELDKGEILADIEMLRQTVSDVENVENTDRP